MVLVLAFAGCVKNEGNGNAGGSSGTGGKAGGGAGGGGSGGTSGSGGAMMPDAMAEPPKSCRDIRVCIHNCVQDMSCASKCVSSAPAAARQQYEEILACSKGPCPTQEEDCRCTEECFNGGQCFDLVDACDEGVSDPWCDVRCH